MAVDYAPATWFTGYSTDATNLKITWASLAGVTNGEADIRNILRAMADEIQAQYDAPSGDAPTKFTSSENTRYNDSSAEFEERRSWSFDLTVDSTSLASE